MNIDEFHSNPLRGLYSYPAPQSRLAENPFARDGLIDLTGPVIRLENLSRDQFGQVYQGAGALLLPEAGIPAFIAHSEQRPGEATFRTPRTTIKAFVGLLAVLEQNEAADWRVLLEQTEVEPEQVVADAGVSDELASLTL
jgi:hypothetical protein